MAGGVLHHLSNEEAVRVLQLAKASPRLQRVVTQDIVFIPGALYNNVMAMMDRGRFCRSPDAYAALGNAPRAIEDLEAYLRVTELTPAERTEGVRPMALVWNNAPLRWLLLGAALGTFINIGVVQWLPNFFIRSHHLSLAQVGLFFGPVLSAGMTAGLLLGGWIGNRIAAVSLVRLIWLSSAVLLAVIPVYLLIFWLPSLPAALFATFVGTALSVVYSAPFTGAWHALCDPRARGTAAGLSSFANALIGGAIGNYLVGVLSDHWAPVFGSESLRYALMASMAICLLPAACFAHAARLHTRQLQEGTHGQEDPAR